VGIMLFCRVALGKTTAGRKGLKESPKGYTAVSGTGQIFSVFNNY